MEPASLIVYVEPGMVEEQKPYNAIQSIGFLIKLTLWLLMQAVLWGIGLLIIVGGAGLFFYVMFYS